MVLSTENMFKEAGVMKSRGALRWDLPTPQNVQPAVNRQPGFRREIVEQKPAFLIFR